MTPGHLVGDRITVYHAHAIVRAHHDRLWLTRCAFDGDAERVILTARPRTLHLSDTRCDPALLADHIAANPNLEYFVLGGGHVNDATVSVIARAAYDHPALRYLSFNRGTYTDASLALFASLFRQNQGFRSLEVLDVNIPAGRYDFSDKQRLDLSDSIDGVRRHRHVCVETNTTGDGKFHSFSNYMHRRRRALYQVLAFFAPPLGAAPLPVTRFLRRDGDNALMHGVVQFMIG